MLKHVAATLEELRLIPQHAPLHYYINLTTGEAISISAFVDAQRFFQVKASEFVNLEHEYHTYQRAWNAFPDFVPRPYGYGSREGWHIMVSEGIAHAPLRAGIVLHPRRARHTLLDDLLRFFEIGKQRATASSDTTHAMLFERIEAHFASTPNARVASAILQRARASGAMALPYVAQHGDFVVNNLAKSGGKLVVFDWEDYAQIMLPGLDLCTLALTLLQRDAAAMRALMQASGSAATALQVFVREACRRSGIEFSFFLRQIPLYLLVFLYLKRNYGSLVQQHIGELVQQLSD